MLKIEALPRACILNSAAARCTASHIEAAVAPFTKRPLHSAHISPGDAVRMIFSIERVVGSSAAPAAQSGPSLANDSFKSCTFPG